VPANPAVDPYFPLGQAALAIAPDGDALRVALKTMTPNFDRFEIRHDNGAWKESAETFAWKLHSGPNRLEARTVNKFGVIGPVSTAEFYER